MAAVAATLCMGPAAGRAAPKTGPEVAAFEAGFQAGQAQYDAGEFLAAARTWKQAAAELPQAPEHRANRAAIHDYMAEAYEKSLEAAADEAVVREAVATLEAYEAGFRAAFPGEAVSPKLAAALERLRGQLRAIEEAAKQQEPEPAPAPKPAEPKVEPPRGKPWRGLAAGGGVALAGGAAMLGLFAFGYSRTSRLEDEIEDPALGCRADMLSGECGDLQDRGKSANAMAVAGLVLGPALLGAGVAMLVVAAKRKKTATQALAPRLGRGFAGVQWQLRF